MLQTADALRRMEEVFPAVRFETVVVSTVGDRDRSTDLRGSPPDFFTRELDAALLGGALDCAVHSAKDLPDPLPAGLDAFRLPWAEDARDAICLPAGASGLPSGRFRLGVSSERRAAYARRRFPDAEQLSIRGNIEERLALLDAGRYDMVIMAVAALKRLGLAWRIHEAIPLGELPPPDGQGALAVTFRRGDAAMVAMRNLLVEPVVFAGAGVGSALNATRAVAEALASCDVCVHDALMPEGLLELLPAAAVRVDVGKRMGARGASQPEICAALARLAKEGRRVVRLKGGDPTVFGRLAEEVDALEAEMLPFRVLPGVGALSVAAAATGLLPSRRGVSRGFTCLAPRQSGSGAFVPVSDAERRELPLIFYMAASAVGEIAGQLAAEGWPAETPAAAVYDAGAPWQAVAQGTLAELPAACARLPAADGDGTARPGLVMVGQTAAARHRFRTHAPLEDVVVAYCGARTGVAKARRAVERHGGRFLELPMIALAPAAGAAAVARRCPEFDWVVATSPSCAELLLRLFLEDGGDLRRLPRVAVCGPGTAAVFEARGVRPDLAPDSRFGSEGLLAAFAGVDMRGRRVLRLRSDAATPWLSDALAALGASVEDAVLYENRPETHAALPEFDAAMFTSPSCVRAFFASFRREAVAGRTACGIGAPTGRALEEAGAFQRIVVPGEATIPAMARALAAAAAAARLGWE